MWKFEKHVYAVCLEMGCLVLTDCFENVRPLTTGFADAPKYCLLHVGQREWAYGKR